MDAQTVAFPVHSDSSDFANSGCFLGSGQAAAARSLWWRCCSLVVGVLGVARCYRTGPEEADLLPEAAV